MSEFSITEEIISLLRGFFSAPLISSLGMLGVLDEMISLSEFKVDDFKNIPNKKILSDSFRYFSRLGLIECINNNKEIYRTTELGRQVFGRASSFYVPHSYHEYMNNYYKQLLDPSLRAKQDVDRLENVIGSGRTHQRYFPPAISYLKRKVNFDIIADIGCGDGHFLEAVLRDIPGKKAVGIDISQIAIDVTSKNLRSRFPGQEIFMICSDAIDVDKWARGLGAIAKEQNLAISMWFLLHEISRNNLENVINYFKKIYVLFPQSRIIICELLRHSDTMLAKYRQTSIMPEYLFFHELSGQGILSWDEYRKILDSIPYKLASERLFDEIADENGKQIPSAFVWCLQPHG